jgi:hypothetical protein
MEFQPRWFGAAIENNSGEYNYYLVNMWRSRGCRPSGDVSPGVALTM